MDCLSWNRADDFLAAPSPFSLPVTPPRVTPAACSHFAFSTRTSFSSPLISRPAFIPTLRKINLFAFTLVGTASEFSARSFSSKCIPCTAWIEPPLGFFSYRKTALGTPNCSNSSSQPPWRKPITLWFEATCKVPPKLTFHSKANRGSFHLLSHERKNLGCLLCLIF